MRDFVKHLTGSVYLHCMSKQQNFRSLCQLTCGLGRGNFGEEAATSLIEAVAPIPVTVAAGSLLVEPSVEEYSVEDSV